MNFSPGGYDQNKFLDQGTNSPSDFYGHNSEEVNHTQMMDSVMSQGSPSHDMNSGRLSGTSEMLFLKRLLYLKASIDSEKVIHTYSVPFAGEKRMGQATGEELGISTGGVLSERLSTAYHSLDPSRELSSVQETIHVLPNTSHGQRNRGSNNRTMISPDGVARVTNSLNFSQISQFDRTADLKKV